MSAPLRICNLVLQATSAPAADLLPLDNNAYASTKRISAAALIGTRVLAGNLLIVDQVNGSDSTGAAGSLGYPFLTLGAAKTAASSGDTVRVYPGTYSERDLLKNGVNWDFLPGANVSYAGSANGGIFDDSSDGANGAVTCSITGSGIFTLNSTGGAADRNSTVRITNSSSSVVIQCRTINNLVGIGGSTQACVRQTAGYLAVEADLLNATGLNSGVWWDAGDGHITVNRIVAVGYGIYVTAGAGTDSLWVTADKISTNAQSLFASTGNASSRVWIVAKELRSTSTAVDISAGKVYILAEKISAVDQPFTMSGGEFWLTLQKLSLDSGSSGSTLTGGFASLEIQHVEDLGCIDACLDLAAVGTTVTCHVENLKTSADAIAGVRLAQSAGGRCAFRGMVDASAATAGNPVALNPTGTLLDGTALISASGQESIVGNGTTINVYGVAYVTHIKAAGVTLGMGTLTTIAGMT